MNYWDIYKDVWNLHKKYSKAENTEEYWDRLTTDASKVQVKHHCRFCDDLVKSVLEELERVCKNNQ